jgi:hypothetical protein
MSIPVAASDIQKAALHAPDVLEHLRKSTDPMPASAPG